FKFFVDKESVVESDCFDVHIFLPKNAEGMLHAYKDGSELPRDIDELKRRGCSGRIESEFEHLMQGKSDDIADWEKETHIKKIKQLEKQASEFPFSQDR